MFPILVLFGIIAIALFGGVKNASLISNNGSTGNTIPTPAERQMSQDEIAYNIQNTQYQTQQLQQKVAEQQEAKISSVYKGQITMSWGGWSSTDPNQEYIEIDANSGNSAPINISGWTLTGTSTNQIITIPQSTGLYFSNQTNSNTNIILSPGERAYIITGRSPIGFGMHVNTCSGYLTQFNNFTPGLYTQCPAPRDEKAVITIPRTINNNNCFDLIDSLGTCRVYTQTLNNSYSPQCQDFVETKLNYQSCVDVHKNDANFWSPNVWYVYLNHDQVLWQPRRETLILTDTAGKKVYTISR